MTGETTRESLRPGDEQAFRLLYNSHYTRIRNFLRVYVNNSATADDLAQETFLQLWKRPNAFDPVRSTLLTYLFGIARKKAADWWRQQPPTAPPVLFSTSPPSGLPSSLLIADAFEHLEPQQRILLWLREVEGHSYSELAEILKIPVGTVRSRLFSAREELRTIWNQTLTGGCDELQRR